MEDLEHIDYLYHHHPLNETYSSRSTLVVKLTMRDSHCSRRYAFSKDEPQIASQPRIDRNTSITTDPAQNNNINGFICAVGFLAWAIYTFWILGSLLPYMDLAVERFMDYMATRWPRRYEIEGMEDEEVTEESPLLGREERKVRFDDEGTEVWHYEDDEFQPERRPPYSGC